MFTFVLFTNDYVKLNHYLSEPVLLRARFSRCATLNKIPNQYLSKYLNLIRAFVQKFYLLSTFDNALKEFNALKAFQESN